MPNASRGTLIYEDEWTLLPQNFREQVHTPTQFSSAVRTNPPFFPAVGSMVCEQAPSFHDL